MASIDEVIERSRQAGEFSERKRFTVARSQAIQKMRQFALADPSYYVLEWIQAAVANGATYLDVFIDADESRMSYVGGGFTRGELEALFDFLFASKDDLELADVRQLALGVNALLLAEPESIVIESGDGTLEGTTRVQIDGKSDNIFVGTPTKPLEGTFVRASGLEYRFGVPPEIRVIEERCLTATIPILVNNDPLFGYSSVRSPDLFGHKRFIKFDEGDLYGSIGIATTPNTRNFKLLTWGTWIASARNEWDGLPPMGGIVGFDRLRKTADHASIVQDAVYDEMWARLSVYAHQLATGESGRAVFDVTLLDDTPIEAQQLRSVVRERNRVVVFVRAQLKQASSRQLAHRYGEVFDAPVFVVGERELESIRHLAGPDVAVYTPSLDPMELRFYEREPSPLPPRPWLTAPVEIDDVDPDVLATRIEEWWGDDSVKELARYFRTASGASASVYTPSTAEKDVALLAEIRIAERTVWVGSIESTFPGHHLVINLQDFPLHLLRDSTLRDAHGAAIARIWAELAEPGLRQATQRLLATSRPGQALSSAARLILLGVLSRTAVKRLRRRNDDVVLQFGLESDDLPEHLLDLPLLETWGGSKLSVRHIQHALATSCGLVYGATTTEAVAQHPGVDADYVLKVDSVAQALVRRLVGPMSYVPLRAEQRSYAFCAGVRCSTFLAGLLSSPSTPLVAVGPMPEPGTEKTEIVSALVRQLLEARQVESVEERLDITRHLIWFAAHAEGKLAKAVRALPLFRAADGQSVSFSTLQLALNEGGVPMYDGWATEVAATLPTNVSAAVMNQDVPLAMNPFVFAVLSRVGAIRPVLDVDLTLHEARADGDSAATAFLIQVEVEGIEGTIGIPMRSVPEPAVLWLHRERGTGIALRDIGHRYGVVGRLFGSSQDDVSDVKRRCIAACNTLYNTLLRGLREITDRPAQYERAVEAMLEYSTERVHIAREPDGSLTTSITDAIAARIMDLPIINTTSGVDVAPSRFVHEYVTYGDREPRPGRASISDDAPFAVRRWLDEVLRPDRIVEHSSWSPTATPPSERERWLTEAFAQLRTDEVDVQHPIRLVGSMEFSRWAKPAEEIFLHGDIVMVCDDSPLARGLGQGAEVDREGAAWLLLAVYARINEFRLSVTNVHEIHFQSRVLEWLDSGELSAS